MEFFQRAKVFRLKCSDHSKYLTADQDQEKIKQSRNKSSKQALWFCEVVDGKADTIRLRSSWSKKYLAASDEPHLLGMTGNKVLQTIKQGPAVEWQVIKEGSYVKLRTHTGSFLKANPRVLPWRNSVTHVFQDNWTAFDYMTLWIVDITEINYKQSADSKEEPKETIDPTVSDVNSNSVNDLEDGPDYETSGELSSENAHQVEVTMAKQTLQELSDFDFNTIQSSELGEKLEQALNVLIRDSELPSQDLLNLLEKLETLKIRHNSACQDLAKYTSFCTTRLNTMTELKKDANKARKLDALQIELKTNRDKREELLQQLNEIDNIIKDVEKTQADNLADVEELISRMGQKSQKLEEMKSEEILWQEKKIEANRMLIRVEEDWETLKTMFPED